MNDMLQRAIALFFCLFAATPQAQGYNQALLEELGQFIFFDEKLSATGKVSCSSCHQPDRAFTDGRKVSQGIDRKIGTRNAPSLIGAAEHRSFFWDGRRDKLADQVLDPFINPVEHGLPSHDDLIERLQRDNGYRQRFDKAFPAAPASITRESLAQALVAFLQTLKPQASPLDRYLFAGDKAALSPSAVAGLDVFRGQAQCASCHLIEQTAAPLMDGKFHSVGVGLDRIMAKLPALTTQVKTGDAKAIDHAVVNDPELSDLGRFLVTGDPRDIGKFKTPSLHNVALTAPYMHDGSVSTLEEAVDREIYYRGLQSGKPIALTLEERRALLAFLRALSTK